MAPTLTLRPATPADLDTLVAFTVSYPLFRDHGMTAARLRPQLEAGISDAGVHFVVAEENGTPIGFAYFVKTGAFARSGYLKLIAVDAAARSKGVGRFLLEALERNFLRPNGLFLLCTHTNVEAREFYERAGYRQVGEIPDYLTPGLHEVLYHKPPPKP